MQLVVVFSAAGGCSKFEWPGWQVSLVIWTTCRQPIALNQLAQLHSLIVCPVWCGSLANVAQLIEYFKNSASFCIVVPDTYRFSFGWAFIVPNVYTATSVKAATERYKRLPAIEGFKFRWPPSCG